MDRDNDKGFKKRGGRRPRRKVCYFSANKFTTIDYKDVGLLRRFVSGGHKIDHCNYANASAPLRLQFPVRNLEAGGILHLTAASSPSGWTSGSRESAIRRRFLSAPSIQLRGC